MPHSQALQASVSENPRTASLVLNWRGKLVFSKIVAGGFVTMMLAVLALWLEHTFVGTNFHTVVPGKIYRSAQLSPVTLSEIVRRYKIRSVINLRGCCFGFDWYERERETLAALGVQQYDVRLSYSSPPPVCEFRNLVRFLSSCEKPVLLHCRRGADRTGLASAIALVLENTDLDTARKQLSAYYGWFPIGLPRRLMQVFDWYEDWLQKTNQERGRHSFIQWVNAHYKPGHLWAEIEPISVPKHWRVGQAVSGRFRVRNGSDFAWELRTTPRTGVHLRAWLLDRDCEIRDPAQLEGFPTDAAGFFEASVPPDASLDITLPLPRTRQPGQYLLLVDLVDARDGPFGIYGSRTFRQWVRVE